MMLVPVFLALCIGIPLAFVSWISKLNDPVPLEVVPTASDLTRVIFTGSSGSGKSTAAARLASLVKSKYISIDGITFRKGNWLESTPSEFHNILKQELEESKQQYENRWVIDGAHFSHGAKPLLWEDSTCIIYLAYPKYYVFFRRLVPRTLRRIFCKEELWGIPDLHENWSNLWARKGVLGHFLRTHSVKLEMYESLREKYQSEGELLIIKVTHPQQLEQWFHDVEEIAKMTSCPTKS